MRVVVGSVHTYLRWAEAVNRLDLAREEKDLPELVEELREGGAAASRPDAGLRRLKLAAMRQLAPDLLLTAKTQR